MVGIHGFNRVWFNFILIQYPSLAAKKKKVFNIVLFVTYSAQVCRFQSYEGLEKILRFFVKKLFFYWFHLVLYSSAYRDGVIASLSKDLSLLKVQLTFEVRGQLHYMKYKFAFNLILTGWDLWSQSRLCSWWVLTTLSFAVISQKV